MPIYIYIVGLFYIYTQFVIGKVEYFLMCLEMKMRQLAKENDVKRIQGWNLFMRKDGNISNFLVYGFLFSVFILLPPISIIIGHSNTFFAGKVDVTNSVNWHCFSKYVVPIFLYVCYGIIGFIFVKKNIVIRKKKIDELD